MTKKKTIIIFMIMTVTQHIPTMTKSHHGGEVSVMMKVGMCQCQKPTIHHDELYFGVYIFTMLDLYTVELYHIWWDFDTDTFPPSSLLTYSHHGGFLSWWEYASKP